MFNDTKSRVVPGDSKPGSELEDIVIFSTSRNTNNGRQFRREVDNVLHNLREHANKAQDTPEVLDVVLQTLHHRGYKGARIWGKDGERYKLVAADNFPEEIMRAGANFYPTNPLLSRIIEGSEIYFFADIQKQESLFTGRIDPLHYVLNRYPSATSMVAVPYSSYSENPALKEFKGLLVVNFDPCDCGSIELRKDGKILRPTSREIGFLEQVSWTVADKVVRLMEQHREWETGLYNRRKFHADLEKYVGEFYRTQKPYTVLLIDFDGFKKFNDQFGHRAGDKFIDAVGESLRQKESSVVRAYHQGGDEFAIINKEDATASIELANSLLQEFRAIRVPGTNDVPLTASIGMAEVQSGIRSGEEWGNRADKAMYQAKALGKDQCVIFTSTF